MYSSRLIVVALALMLLMSAASMLPRGFEASASTFEAWEFNALGDVLAMSTTKDVSGDGVDEIIVAVEHFIFLVDGATGKEIWNYDVNDAFTWIAAVALDINNDGKPDVLAASDNRLVMLLDGATGEQVWNFTIGSLYEPGDPCYPLARSFHLVSDIDDDSLSDAIVVSGSGDQCSKDDEFSVLALNAKNGEKIWEYVHNEDFHGLKDGTRVSSPTDLVDINQDGKKDIAIVDDHNILYVIDELTGSVIETEEIDVFGAIWNLMVVPDLSGDGIDDAIVFEFIEGGGGPDYASIDAIDMAEAKVLWQAKAGDGQYNGAALYSMAWTKGDDSAQSAIRIAAIQRIENELELIMLDGITGHEIWRFGLGEDKSRNDLAKYYPIAKVPDLNGNGYDELAVGSIGPTIHLLDTNDANALWSHSVNGGGRAISLIQSKDDQWYILVGDKESRVNALAGLTTIETGLTIDASEETIVLSHKVKISGTIFPPLPGEVVQIRYIDPTGFVTSKPIVITKDGSYGDEIQPEVIGRWKVSASFAGEGYYTGSASPTIAFTVENETKNFVYNVEVESDDNTSVSYPVVYFIEGGRVNEMSIDTQQKSLDITIMPTAGGGALRLELSRSMIDAWDSSYQVYVDGRAAEFDEIEADMQTRTLSIPFSSDSEQIQVIGTYIVPEFPTVSLMLALATIGMITIVAMRNRSFSVKSL